MGLLSKLFGSSDARVDPSEPEKVTVDEPAMLSSAEAPAKKAEILRGL